MRNRTLTLGAALGAFALAVSLAGSAQAILIAGWDFSQYYSDGALTTDEAFNPANTLSANYSNLDPTFSAGEESAQFGTLYIDGNFGSSLVVVDLSGQEVIVPTAGSLGENINAPVSAAFPGSVPFDTFNVLQFEGQDFRELLSLVARGPVQVVFGATLASVPEFGTDWSFAFAGRTNGGTSLLGVEYSTNGSDYAGLPSQSLAASEALFNVPITAAQAERIFVRLSFNAANGQPVIDNFSIHATTAIPEPGTALLLSLGLLGLAASSRIRFRA